ncbi:HAD-like domain containing protein [Cryptosporidium tyzzeri]|nr:HAD-like domain containing protein [Cryptosporidium tyzzeri]
MFKKKNRKNKKLLIGTVGANYDGTITKYNTFETVILQACKKYYSNKPQACDMLLLEQEAEKILNTHINDRLLWCNEWLPETPLEKFDGNAIAKIFLAISEFEYIYNFKIEKEMKILQLLNSDIVDGSSVEFKEGWEFREGAFETLKSLCEFTNRFIIVSTSKGSKRIKDTVEGILSDNEGKCELEISASEFEYKSESCDTVETAPNSLYGPSCKYRAFRQSVKEINKQYNKRMRDKIHYVIASISMNAISKHDIYIKSIFFGNKVNDLECILYSEIGVIIADSPALDNICDAKTSEHSSIVELSQHSSLSTIENTLNIDHFMFKICLLFSIQIVPISNDHTERIQNSGLKVYKNILRDEEGIADIRDFLRVSRMMRYHNSKTSQFRFNGILLLAFSWDEVSRFFFPRH